MLKKGIELAGDVGDWAFALINKMMRALGMKIAQTIEELTEELIRRVLNRILKMIANQVAKALQFLH